MFGGFLRPKFDANKTKVNLKMLINRLNLLTQKKANLAKQQKREIALLHHAGIATLANPLTSPPIH